MQRAGFGDWPEQSSSYDTESTIIIINYLFLYSVEDFSVAAVFAVV